MRIWNNSISVEIRPGSLRLLTLLLLTIPLHWCIAWFFAALIHETGHLLALRLLKEKITGISFNGNGIQISVGELTAGRGILCAIAGPVFGLLPLLTAKFLPRLAICAAVQFVCNLLPVGSLDGGRIVGYLVNRLPIKTKNVIELVLLIFMLAFAVILSLVFSLRLLPFVLAGFLLCRYFGNKKNLQRLTGKSTIVVPK